MQWLKSFRLLWSIVFFILVIAASPTVRAQEQVLVPYGGQNETVAHMWVGIEKGLFKKYGLDVKMLQVRSGPIIMSALASGAVKVIWPAPSSVLSAASGGLKVSCAASPMDKIPRELVVRKEIKSFDDLRGKVFGVQSIGGGFWLQTMVPLESLGLDPDRYQLRMRVIGDTATVTQALIAKMIDAAMLPYSFSEPAKREGLHSLADIGKLKFPFQGNSICFQRDLIVNSPDLIMSLVKGVIEAVVLIHDPKHKQDVMEILKKNLRLAKAEDVETSYKVLQLGATVEVAPNMEAWKTIQRVVSRVNPAVRQVDLREVLEGSFVRSLEENGFLPGIRKKLRL